jgi:hypothetical protein
MGNEVWKRKWRRANDEYQHLQNTVNMVLEEDGGHLLLLQMPIAAVVPNIPITML